MERVCIAIMDLGNVFDYFIKEMAIPFLTSWPFVGLLVILLLRKQLQNLIDRIKSAKGLGVTIDMTEQNGGINPVSNQLVGGVVPLKPKKGKSKYPVPVLVENGFKKYMEGLEATLRKDLAESPYEEIDILIRDDIQYRMIAEFEWLYRIIFGSQIEFLFQLERKIEIKDKDASRFFDSEMLKRKVDNLSYDEWISFMINRGDLIKNEKKIYRLTDKGLAFLTFINFKNYDYKPYSL